MLQGFIKSNSFGWIIFQHPANKVKQTLMICVLAMHEFLKGKEKKGSILERSFTTANLTK